MSRASPIDLEKRGVFGFANRGSSCARESDAPETFPTICETRENCEIDGAREKIADERRLSCQYRLKLGWSRGQYGRDAHRQSTAHHHAMRQRLQERAPQRGASKIRTMREHAPAIERPSDRAIETDTERVLVQAVTSPNK